jgi:triosephosphate isomerase
MYVVGNWKMNGLREEAREVSHAVAHWMHQHEETTPECVLCPPATAFSEVRHALEGVPRSALGAQDASPEDGGAYTGELSAALLRDAGCGYVILGHSERRRYHQETDALVARKAAAVLRAGLHPIICVGESLGEYEANRTLPAVEAQALASVPDGHTQRVLIAYEPVWAIGSGKIPSLDEIEIVHGAIAAFLTEKKGIDPEQISVLYGGSVKSANAGEILRIPDVEGVLVGGASLNPEEFCCILAAAQSRDTRG